MITPHARSAAARFDRLAATTTNSAPSNSPVTSRAAPTAARLGIPALAACASKAPSVAIHASRRGARAIQRGKIAQLIAMPAISSAATPVAASSPAPNRRISTPTNSGIRIVPLVAIAYAQASRSSAATGRSGRAALAGVGESVMAGA